MADRDGGDSHMAEIDSGSPASLRDVALGALRDVASDPKAPPAARAQASRTILEALGLLRSGEGSLEPETGDVATMSRADLDREIGRLQRESGDRATVRERLRAKTKG